MVHTEGELTRAGRVRLDPGRLRAFCEAALRAAGASTADAAAATDVLVRTDLRGVHSHGVQTLPSHIRNLREGGTTSPTSPTIVRESAVTAVVDGHDGIGLVVATYAMDLAIAKARESGVGVVTVRDSNHFGAAGHYALSAAERGFIGLATSNASPIMTAAGSRQKMISNAPFAYGVPTPAFPMVLDIAMSTTAGMKVRLAAERGEEIPADWVVDETGRPTTDPAAYAAGGALAPLGGHKGYGLAMLTETLAGALSGSAMTSAVVPWLVHPGTPTGAGHCFLAFDIAAFMEPSQFQDRMRGLVAQMRAAAPAPGVERVLVPGELEHEAEHRALAEGVELEHVIWHHLEQVAQDLSLGGQLAEVPVGHQPDEERNTL